MKAADIGAIDARAAAGFTYDGGDPNIWRSHADQVLAGQPWHGACADRASTTLDLLGRAGMSLEARYRLVVMSVNGRHMVGCATDDDGELWVVGDTFAQAPYPAGEMVHRPIEYNRLSEAGPAPTWRAGAPWALA